MKVNSFLGSQIITEFAGHDLRNCLKIEIKENDIVEIAGTDEPTL
jgi:hypothetical protein